jgi:hypothetical protein
MISEESQRNENTAKDSNDDGFEASLTEHYLSEEDKKKLSKLPPLSEEEKRVFEALADYLIESALPVTATK